MEDVTRKERFVALLGENRRRLQKVVATYGVTPEDREDLGQEILAQLWRSFSSYDAARPFATWMYRVALNVAISHVRGVARRRGRIAEPASHPLDPPDPRSLAREPNDERGTILERLMATLDELDRALLLLHLEERSYREIADVLGLSETNVGTKLNRLRERLRQMVNKEMAR